MKYLFFLTIYFFSLNAFAQKQGNVWYFGYNAGLNFNVTPPAILNNGALSTSEGCSSISDPSTGQLLFYSDGISVWDKNHNLMPASVGTNMTGNASSTQSGVIVPKPGSSTIFYIFTTPAEGLGSLAYSIVDMSLNGGNGNVTSFNNIIMLNSTEKIAAVGNCDNSEYWVCGHQFENDSFYAVKVTSAGVSAPVKSRAGSVHTNISGIGMETIGYMKFSSDGKKLGLVNWVELNFMEIFDFDMNTGIFSNPIKESFATAPGGFDGLYGCTFSPDNTKFYCIFSGFGGSSSKIYQYNMLAGSNAAILASKAVVGTYPDALGAMQNGPDGKCYVINTGTSCLMTIDNPNSLAPTITNAAVNYTGSGSLLSIGLPAIVENFLSKTGGQPFVTPKDDFATDDIICLGDTVVSIQTVKKWWNILPNTDFHRDGDSLIMYFYPKQNTTYTVYTTASSCVNGDTSNFSISIQQNPNADFNFNPIAPTLANSTLQAINASTGASSYKWFDPNVFIANSTDASVAINGLGPICFMLEASSSEGCLDTAYKCINVEDTLNTVIYLPNAFTPFSTPTVNDVIKLKGDNFTLKRFAIFNRYGQMVFSTSNSLVGWDGNYNGAPCEIGTYYYAVEYIDVKKKTRNLKGDIALIK